jgi:hypothetical protein
MAKRDYQTILIEQLVDQNKAILEYVGELPGIKRDMVQLKEDVAECQRAHLPSEWEGATVIRPGDPPHPETLGSQATGAKRETGLDETHVDAEHAMYPRDALALLGIA